MAHPLLENPVSAEVFKEAGEALGFDLAGLISEGPENELILTSNAQPAILATSLAVWRLLDKALGDSLRPAFVAGHSLGEFSALAAAGSLGIRDAVRLVRKRGKLMQNAVPAGVGAMAALVGGTEEDARALVAAAASGDVLDVANLNAPGQTVISGHAAAVHRAVAIAKDWGFKRAVQLKVSAPFHSRLMGPVREAFERELLGYEFSAPDPPVVHNVTAEPNEDPSAIRGLLARQIDSPVRWVDSVRRMIDGGVAAFVEVGYGTVLQGLVKKTAEHGWPGVIVGCAAPGDRAGTARPPTPRR